MRTVLTAAFLGALVYGGCKKPQPPQTTEPKPPMATAGGLEPLTPPKIGEATAMPAPAEPTPLTPPVPVATPAPAESPRMYIVQKGDTLWKIAVSVYGDGQRYRDIEAANPGLVPNKMKVGQKLVLPPK